MPQRVSIDKEAKKGREFIETENFAGSDIDEQEASDQGFESGDEVHDSTMYLGKKALFKRAEKISTQSSNNIENLTSPLIEKNEQDEHQKPDSQVAINKQRVLLIASRGIIHRYRHLMEDLHSLLPHTKKDSKLDAKGNLYLLNEIAELNNCNNCIFFETRKHTDLYLWMAKTPNGPSVKFHVQNVHTMEELRLTGNCLKGSRHILSFDSGFDEAPHLKLIKEILTQTFAVPKTSRRVKPFIDHVISFSLVDGRIWFRNYQIVEAEEKDQEDSMVEIGPRFVLNPMRIFSKSFGGPTLYENPNFVSPNAIRRSIKQEKQSTQMKRRQDNEARDIKMKQVKVLPRDETMDIFA